MELPRLIEDLSDAAAYPHAVDAVEVRQTHISVVFLAGPYAYKVKKPVDLGFLDYSTLERRRHHCEQEVRLNRRLAPGVYLGVVPVASGDAGARMEGDGDVVEWAVKMTRLPEDATLRDRLRRGEVASELVQDLARRLAAFHARVESGGPIASYGRFEVVAGNARENFEQSASAVGTAVSSAVFERLRSLTERALAEHRTLIDRRAERGVPRDTHGDLRLEHVYAFPDRMPPNDLVIVDCIEFNDRFRYADPVCDMAFLSMDLSLHGRCDLSRAFADAYFRAAVDEEGRALLPFYTAYRAAVRGKVLAMKHAEREVPAADRARALAQSRAHWLLALGELEDPSRRPCLVLIGGLPGSGKSTLGMGLAEHAGFTVIRSDVVRKELTGRASEQSSPGPYGEGIYSPAWTERTYAECARRAEELLFDGRRVVVDASFGREARRRDFLDPAARWGVPATFLHCRAEPAVVRARLAARRHDASDADWSIYLQSAARWEDPAPATQRATREIDAAEGRDRTLSQALDVLRATGLQD